MLGLDLLRTLDSTLKNHLISKKKKISKLDLLFEMSSFSSPNLVFEQTYDDIFLNCPVPKTVGIKRWAKIHTKKMQYYQAFCTGSYSKAKNHCTIFSFQSLSFKQKLAVMVNSGSKIFSGKISPCPCEVGKYHLQNLGPNRLLQKTTACAKNGKKSPIIIVSHNFDQIPQI